MGRLVEPYTHEEWEKLSWRSKYSGLIVVGLMVSAVAVFVLAKLFG
jgi:hypothetical protein